MGDHGVDQFTCRFRHSLKVWTFVLFINAVFTPDDLKYIYCIITLYVIRLKTEYKGLKKSPSALPADSSTLLHDPSTSYTTVTCLHCFFRELY